MQRWRGLTAAPAGWGRSVVTIGVFDGVHRGHQAIIGHAVDRARALGVASVVVTFDPHPAEVVRPGSHPAVLTEPGFKAALIEGLGVDVLCVIPFTLSFSQLPAESFVHDVLVEHLHASAVVVGDNFRFGHKALGDTTLLASLGQRFGFTVEPAPLVGAISSTFIRSLVDAGSVEEAATALGRPHRLEGIVVRGDQRGRDLGFPTANLATSAHAAIPADGVYAAWLSRRDGQRLRAAVSVGTNPTFNGADRRVEAFALDFSGDLYGERLALDFVAHLRPMLRFDGIEPLIAQMTQDVQATRSILT